MNANTNLAVGFHQHAFSPACLGKSGQSKPVADTLFDIASHQVYFIPKHRISVIKNLHALKNKLTSLVRNTGIMSKPNGPMKAEVKDPSICCPKIGAENRHSHSQSIPDGNPIFHLLIQIHESLNRRPLKIAACRRSLKKPSLFYSRHVYFKVYGLCEHEFARIWAFCIENLGFLRRNSLFSGININQIWRNRA
jgi:hypothetical protein